MQNLQFFFEPFRRRAIMAVCVFLHGCSTSSAMVNSRLDPETGVTITYVSTPLVFYKDDSGRAAYARNFVHLAPVQVNQTGNLRYYLWLGIWNTTGDERSDETRDGFESVIVFADGEPLPLGVSGWTTSAISASYPVYVKPVASAADAYYEVTADQIRLIATARNLRLMTTGPRQHTFELWDEQQTARSNLRLFLDATL